MENSFEKIPINENDDNRGEELKKRLEKTNERLETAEKEIMKRHIENLVRDVLPDFPIAAEDISNLSNDEEIRDLAEKIFSLEHQSQTTIEEGGYTNKDKAKLYRGQLASLAERKIIERRKEEKAA